MSDAAYRLSYWPIVEAQLLKRPAAMRRMRVARYGVTHPSMAGFRRGVGAPSGQIADWRREVGSGCLHVLEFPRYYDAHLDLFDPAKHPVLHGICDLFGIGRKG